MDQTDKDVALLKRYLRARGLKTGKGVILDKLMKTITHGNENDLRLLGKVMNDPRQAAALMGLAIDDLTGTTRVRRSRKKVRRGIGSY